MKAYNIIATGKVQDVGFRRSVQHKAWQFGVVGEVKNLADGSVMILAQGEDELLGEFIGSLSSIDPPVEVKKLVKAPTRVSKQRKNFKIKHGMLEEELEEGLGVVKNSLL